MVKTELQEDTDAFDDFQWHLADGNPVLAKEIGHKLTHAEIARAYLKTIYENSWEPDTS
jgi:hypothetical protein